MQAFNAVAVFAGLAAAVSWGISDFFAASASKKFNSLIVTVFVMIFSVVSFSLVYFFGLSHAHEWHISGVLLAAASGVLMTIAVTAFYRGLGTGVVSIVSPIGAAYPLVTTLLVVLFFQARLQIYQAIGIAVAVFGIMAASGIFRVKQKELRLNQGVAFALIACLAWGGTWAFLGQSITTLGWEKATLVQSWFMVVGCLAILPFISMRELFSRASITIARNKYVFGAALLQTTGLVALSFGLTHATSTAVETTISACYPIITIMLAVIIFKEKTDLVTKAGIVATILGVATISYH